MNKTPCLSRLAASSLLKQAMEGESLKRLEAAAYEAVYINDLFCDFSPPGVRTDPSKIIFSDASGSVLLRSKAEAVAFRGRLDEFSLDAVSAHFMETLPPPGAPPEWIFPVHEAFLDIASSAGLRLVTSHAGAMFGMPALKGGSFQELCHNARLAYGEEKALADSAPIYRHLCEEALKRGISVSIEVGCEELPAISCDIQRLLEFIASIGAPNLGICLDAGHCNARGLNPARSAKECGKLLVETHVHDNDGSFDSHSPLGSGNIDWPAYAKALAESGYGGLITFEQSEYEANASFWRRAISSF